MRGFRGGRGGRGRGRGRGGKRKDFGGDGPGFKRHKPNQQYDLVTRVLDLSPLTSLPDKSERFFGISTFLTHSPGFRASLKERYSDFHVSEVDTAGNVVSLTSSELPPGYEDALEEPADVTDLSSEAYNSLRELVSEEQTTAFHGFINQSEDSGDRVDEFFFDQIASKDTRTVLHKLIEQHFEGFNSDTKDGKIRVCRKGSKAHRSRSFDKRDKFWGNNPNQYLQFVLHKQNIDTLQAVSRIANLSGHPAKAFRYGGTKDRRAITSQLVTAWRLRPEKLKQLQDRLSPAVYTGNYKFVPDEMNLGTLSGNHFEIILRDVESEDAAKEAAEQLKEKGFVNYFGMQRFGSGAVPTSYIGRALIKDDFKEAVRLILAEHPKVREESKRAYHEASERNWEVAANLFPRFLSAEVNLCRALSEYGEKQLEACFLRIPRNLRLMYLHAYQSFLWNHLVTFRLENLDSSIAVEGDLVYSADLDKDSEANAIGISEERRKQMKRHRDLEVRFVTKEEEECKKFDISDVLIPLPGYDVKIPSNAVGEELNNLLQADNLTLEDFKHRHKEFALTGSYRQILTKPEKFEWKLFRYDDHTVPLILTDIEKMNNCPEPESVPNGKFVAMKLSFNLKSSCYATMLFRELTKEDSFFQQESEEADDKIEPADTEDGEVEDGSKKNEASDDAEMSKE